jgi:hypothetical protein
MKNSQEKIYPFTVKGRFIAPSNLEWWSHISTVLFILLWGFATYYTYISHRPVQEFAVMLVIFGLTIVWYAYGLALIKPVMMVSQEGVRIVYKDFAGMSVDWKDIGGIKMTSQRDDRGDKPYLAHALVISYKETTQKHIKLPMGITRYGWSWDEKRIAKLKEKLQKYPVKLEGFETDIDTQNKNYSMER